MIKTFYRSLRLRAKLAVILIASVAILSVIAGIYFDYFLRDSFAKTTYNRIMYTFQRFDLHLKDIEEGLKKGIAFIKEDESVLASIELIDTYQDKMNYDAVLLDEEKKRLADELLNRVKLSSNNDIALYDSNQELMVYVIKTAKGYYLNYVSYESGKPVLYSRYENEPEYTLRPFAQYWLFPYKHISYYSKQTLLDGGAISYHRFHDDLVIAAHQSLFQTDNEHVLAHIEMCAYISKPYYQSLSNDLGFTVYSRAILPEGITLSSGKKKAVLDGIGGQFIGISSMSTQNGNVYIIALLDKSALQTMLNKNRFTFIGLIVFLTLLTLWIAKMLFDRGIAKPLYSLMGQIEKIERQDYSHSHILRTGDELEAISRNVQRLAETVHDRETALIASQKQLEYLSNTDPLTDLPNRRFFNHILQEYIDRPLNQTRSLAILFLDLDQFKQVNDSLGHDIGDLLLQGVAQRLQNIIPSSSTIARIGGDEFNILIENFTERSEIEKAVFDILNSFDSPFICADNEIRTSVSIGISIFPDDGKTITALIKNADMAMYRAKETGRNRHTFFTQDMANLIEDRSHRLQALKTAFEKKDEFYLVYQPKISASTGKISGMEALVRWNSRDLGRVNPDQFITLAEESGFIVPLGTWIMEQACSDFMQLRDETLYSGHISINVSSLQLQDDHFYAIVTDIVNRTKIDPKQLEIELTESYLATDAHQALSVLATLRSMGISIAIDDFGTGYSSMSYLKRLPITRIKIDKSFVDDLPVSTESIAVTRAIIALAQTFELSVTAEGVENAQQLEFLQNVGCHEIQGYYYSKPLLFEDLKAFVKSHQQ